MTTVRNTFKSALLKSLLPVFAILLMVVAALFAVKAFLKGNHPSSVAGKVVVELNEGVQIPDFSLWTLEGKEVLFSSVKAKVVLVNFWATWCDACMMEMPSIVKVRNELKDRGFEVLAVNVDEEPLAVVPSAMKRFQINFPVFVDKNNQLVDLFNVHGIPLSFIVDKDRKIVFIETGERDWNSKETRVQLERWLTQSSQQ